MVVLWGWISDSLKNKAHYESGAKAMMRGVILSSKRPKLPRNSYGT
jgi:hypothetical protein